MIYTATRDPATEEIGHPFQLTDQFGEVNTSSPFLADDGMTLYFSSPRAGGEGPSDIWMSRRTTVE